MMRDTKSSLSSLDTEPLSIIEGIIQSRKTKIIFVTIAVVVGYSFSRVLLVIGNVLENIV